MDGVVIQCSPSLSHPAHPRAVDNIGTYLTERERFSRTVPDTGRAEHSD